MSKRTDQDFLIDIREAIYRIVKYAEKLMYNSFLADLKTQDAVIRNLEIIGEAAKNLSTEIRSNNPDIPWKEMAGVRNRLIHDYFGVNLDIVWDIISVELPKIKTELDKILKE